MEWREFIRVFNAGWGFCVIVNQEIPESILADMELGGYGKIKKLGKIL
jgi:phosphoribosylaminoimidazole (AIR) synthetase